MQEVVRTATIARGDEGRYQGPATASWPPYDSAEPPALCLSMFDTWWMATIPGLAIFVTTLAINLVGDGLRDLLDPYSRTNI